MKTKPILASIPVALALAAPVHAAPQATLPIFKDVARNYWGVPACGEPEVEFVPAGSLGEAWPGVRAIGRGGDCRIWLDSGWFSYTTWPEACKIVVHEWGHSISTDFDPAPGEQSHSPDPNNIMHDEVGGARFAPCSEASLYPAARVLADAAGRRWRKARRDCLRRKHRRKCRREVNTLQHQWHLLDEEADVFFTIRRRSP